MAMQRPGRGAVAFHRRNGTGIRVPCVSEAQCRVRPEADKLKRSVIGLLLDQHEVRPDVAVAEVAPGTAQRVVVVVGNEGNVVGEGVHDDGEPPIEVVTATTPALASVVALEPVRPLDRPHAGRRTRCRRPRTAAGCRRALPSWGQWSRRWA